MCCLLGCWLTAACQWQWNLPPCLPNSPLQKCCLRHTAARPDARRRARPPLCVVQFGVDEGTFAAAGGERGTAAAAASMALLWFRLPLFNACIGAVYWGYSWGRCGAGLHCPRPGLARAGSPDCSAAAASATMWGLAVHRSVWAVHLRQHAPPQRQRAAPPHRSRGDV
jgi:hypothetical protein